MKFVKYFLILAVCCILLGAGSIYGLYRYIEPQLPDVATLKDVRLQIPMQIYSADGELIVKGLIIACAVVLDSQKGNLALLRKKK